VATTSTVGALLKRTNLIRTLTISNLKQAHRNTVLGYLWWLLDPFMMTAVYTIVIGIIRGRSGVKPAYPAFVMCGLITWKAFANTITQSISVVSKSEGIIKSFSFPKAALPISLVLANHILFLFGLIPLVLLCLIYKFFRGVEEIQIGMMFVMAAPIAVVHLTLGLGGALLLSCFGVFFRDLSNLMRHVLRMMWFLSPGLYAIGDIRGLEGYDGFLSTDWSRPVSVYVLNPFAHVMEGYRATIMYGEFPDLPGIAFAFILGILSVAAGLWVFQRFERKFAKVL
jgi:ABC-type polysaccharide/polyol phosphate export permease